MHSRALNEAAWTAHSLWTWVHFGKTLIVVCYGLLVFCGLIIAAFSCGGAFCSVVRQLLAVWMSLVACAACLLRCLGCGGAGRYLWGGLDVGSPLGFRLLVRMQPHMQLQTTCMWPHSAPLRPTRRPS